MTEVPLDELLQGFAPEYSPWVEIGQRIGADNLRQCLDVLGSGKIHAPSVEAFVADLEREARNESMRADFRGDNYDELAMRHNLTPRQVRRIVHGPASRKK